MNASLVFNWRFQYRELAPAVGGFVSMVVSSTEAANPKKLPPALGINAKVDPAYRNHNRSGRQTPIGSSMGNGIDAQPATEAKLTFTATIRALRYRHRHKLGLPTCSRSSPARRKADSLNFLGTTGNTIRWPYPMPSPECLRRHSRLRCQTDTTCRLRRTLTRRYQHCG